MKINWITPKEILDFEKEIEVELVVNEILGVRLCESRTFHVSFPKAESMENSCLVGYFGVGTTIDNALKDYCRQVSGKHMAINPCECTRRNIWFPNLTHTKLLGY